MPYKDHKGVTHSFEEKGYIYDTWDMEQRQMDPASANYSTTGGMSGDNACAGCRWFVPSRDACICVSGDILPTGVCDLYMAPQPYVQQPIPVTIVAGDAPMNMKNLAQSLPIVGKLFGDGTQVPSPIVLFKDTTGQMRFFCHPSNCFRDREHEILKSAAHKEYVDWVTNNPQFYPPLELWHVPATKCGQVEWVDYADDFLCASGVVFKEWEAVVTKAVQDGAGMSHGFFPVHDSNDARDVNAYRSFEFTILPVAYAANSLTDINLLEWSEKDMGFNPAKRKFFQDLGLSEEQITSFEASTKQLSDRAKSMGIDFKDNLETDEQASLVPQLTALTETISAMAGTLSTLVENQKSINTELATTKELATKAAGSFDEAVTKQFEARSNPTAAGFIASQAQNNIDEAASAKLKEVNGEKDFFDLLREQAIRPYTAPAVGIGAGSNSGFIGAGANE